MLNRRSAVIPPCSSLSLDKSAANKPKALSGSRLVVLQLVNVRAHESVLLLLAWCELKPREINARQQEKKRGEKQRSRSFRVFTRTYVNVTIHNSIGYIYICTYMCMLRDAHSIPLRILKETGKNYDTVNLNRLFESETWRRGKMQDDSRLLWSVYFGYLRHAWLSPWRKQICNVGSNGY